MDGFSLTWTRTAGDSIIPVGPGVYVVPVKGASLAARAATLSRLLPENVVIARRTAAWIWGLDVLPPGTDEADWDVELITLTPPAEPPGRCPTPDAEAAGSTAPPPGPHDQSAAPKVASSVASGPTSDPDSPASGQLSEAISASESSLGSRGSSAVSADTVDVPADHIVEEGGVRITSPTRTALDCARWLPRYDAVAALDQFLRRGVEPGDLVKMARTLPGYRGNKRLREVIRLGDRGAASLGESWMRVAVVKSGFPRPDTQVPVMGRHGRWLYVDLGYPDFRVGLEYDGERYHSGRRARAHDARRRSWLAKEMGWEIIPVTKNFLYRPAPYLEALLTAMLQRGWMPDDAAMEHLTARLSRLRRRR